MKRRDARKRYLAKAGFLPFEQQAYAKIPLSVPYLKDMIKVRRKMMRDAQKGGFTQKQFQQKIINLYHAGGYTKKTEKLTRLDPFTFLRAREDEYKKLNPQYKGEYREKLPILRKDFISKEDSLLLSRRRR